MAHFICACTVYFTAFQKILQAVEGIRYDVQKLTKQQELLGRQLHLLVDNRPISIPALPSVDDDFQLPVENDLTELEDRLRDPQCLQSLVGVQYVIIYTDVYFVHYFITYKPLVILTYPAIMLCYHYISFVRFSLKSSDISTII